uniref:Uncharacterized protein n=1 Tax=Romanomermis culicivorax TaxID=13658 RepID=A0A915KJI8_ROMCU
MYKIYRKSAARPTILLYYIDFYICGFKAQIQRPPPGQLLLFSQRREHSDSTDCVYIPLADLVKHKR